MSFAKYVGKKVIERIKCGPIFRTEIDEIKRKSFEVYPAKYPIYSAPNLVLIKTIENPKELYFRSFLGCKMMEEIKNTISPKFRVKKGDLEKKIVNLLDEINEDNIFRN